MNKKFIEITDSPERTSFLIMKANKHCHDLPLIPPPLNLLMLPAYSLGVFSTTVVGMYDIVKRWWMGRKKEAQNVREGTTSALARERAYTASVRSTKGIKSASSRQLRPVKSKACNMTQQDPQQRVINTFPTAKEPPVDAVVSAGGGQEGGRGGSRNAGGASTAAAAAKESQEKEQFAHQERVNKLKRMAKDAFRCLITRGVDSMSEPLRKEIEKMGGVGEQKRGRAGEDETSNELSAAVETVDRKMETLVGQVGEIKHGMTRKMEDQERKMEELVGQVGEIKHDMTRKMEEVVGLLQELKMQGQSAHTAGGWGGVPPELAGRLREAARNTGHVPQHVT
jgi:hypothetical protein